MRQIEKLCVSLHIRMILLIDNAIVLIYMRMYAKLGSHLKDLLYIFILKFRYEQRFLRLCINYDRTAIIDYICIQSQLFDHRPCAKIASPGRNRYIHSGFPCAPYCGCVFMRYRTRTADQRIVYIHNQKLILHYYLHSSCLHLQYQIYPNYHRTDENSSTQIERR